MEEILEKIAESPAFRALIEGIALKIVAEILHRRATDPDFLNRSDALFSQRAQAQTEEEKLNAQSALAALMSSG